MNRIKDFFKAKGRKFLAVVGSAMALACTFVSTCFASDETPSAITSTMTTSFQGVISQVSSVVTSMLPYALSLLGLVMSITMGIKVFKKLTGKAG